MTADPTGPLKGPIFIMGFPRSGTSGLASGLSKLPGFASYGAEGHFIHLLDTPITSIRDNRLNPNSIVREAEPKGAFMRILAQGVDAVYCSATGSDPLMWIDKSPDIQQVNAIPAIHALFPEAWFFYIYRDAVSAVRSNIANWPKELQGKELDVGRRWQACQAAWRAKSASVPVGKRIEIFQSDLRDNPEQVVERIAEMLSLNKAEAAPLLQFWSENKTVNRPNSGDAKAAYDAVSMDDAMVGRIAAICAAETSNWPRLPQLTADISAAPATALKLTGRLARIRAALSGGTKPVVATPQIAAMPAAQVLPAPPPAVALARAAPKVGRGAQRSAFVGHVFHSRTKSSEFFIDLMRQVSPEVDRYNYDQSATFDYTGLIDRDYTQRIFWQSESILARSRHLYTGRNIVVPMYDAAILRPLEYWHGFGGDLFISFSAMLHNRLQGAGCDSVLVQYWPAPATRTWDPDAPLSAFFWDRRPGSDYDATHIMRACARIGIPKLHIHLASDTGGDPAQRRGVLIAERDNASLAVDLSFSEWYDNKSDLKAATHAHAVYFAARTHEGIGMSFLEAMAHGQIVIGMNNPTLNEYVANGSNGYLFGQNFGISRGQHAFRNTMLEMSDRAIDSVAEGYEQWQRDAARLVEILRTGDSGGKMDAGSDFEREIKVAAGDRAGLRHP